MSRIDAPDSTVSGEAAIAGIAFAGDRGISKIEVSTDGSQTEWEQAEIKSPLSPYTWSLWHRQWVPPQAGKHKIIVRATDGRGVTQTSQYAPPAPDGSSGYHSKLLTYENKSSREKKVLDPVMHYRVYNQRVASEADKNGFLRSGELARLAGVSAETLRHYERKGLLVEPRRSRNGLSRNTAVGARPCSSRATCSQRRLHAQRACTHSQVS